MSIPRRNSKLERISTTLSDLSLQTIADILFPVLGIVCELTEERMVGPGAFSSMKIRRKQDWLLVLKVEKSIKIILLTT